jgi:predicted RNA-binding Zn ribbon-like protein
MVTFTRAGHDPLPSTAQPHPLFSSSVGGVLCLDFVNSVGGRLPGNAGDEAFEYQDVVRTERLTTYAVLVEWATWMGVLSPDDARRLCAEADSRQRESLAVWTRAIAMREAIYRLGKASLEGWPTPAADLDLLNRELRVARSQQVLEPGRPATTPARRRAAPAPGEPYRWTWDAPDDALDVMLWPIASSAADLLASDDLRRVGQCPAAGCGWLFLDTSRSGRRQWCDMAVCGNAEKVRRFRERQREKQRGRRRTGRATSRG